MTLLIIGLLMWSAFHLLPSIAVGTRKKLISRLGEGGYSGIVALLILIGLVLSVFGWRSITPHPVYVPPDLLMPVTWLLMFLSFMLFVSSGKASRIKQFIRHPQLTGVLLWCVAHLLQNGDARSVVLFGWLGVWAVLEMLFINRRDGVWVKEGAPTWMTEMKSIAIALIVFVIALFAHPYISGKAIM